MRQTSNMVLMIHKTADDYRRGVTVIEDYDQAAWFTPDAIRDYYDGSEDNPTLKLSDEELTAIGQVALQDEYFWDVYGQVLGDAVNRFTSKKIEAEEREGGAT
jgi:hypothetical protein